MTEAKHFKTIVISDVHLGSKWSKAKEANLFLKHHICDTLILCGDIIDGWELTGICSDEGFLLGYMVNNGFAPELRRWCAAYPQYSVHVFWDRADAPQTLPAEGGLIFHRLDDRLFLDYMRRCRGYVTTAGFESVCEALYHRKPMMLIPAHIEQRINAIDAVASGAGIAAESFEPGRFIDYLDHCPVPDPAFRSWADSAEARFMQLLTRS